MLSFVTAALEKLTTPSQNRHTGDWEAALLSVNKEINRRKKAAQRSRPKACVAGGKFWQVDDLRKPLWQKLDPATIKKVMRLDRRTFQEVLAMKYQIVTTRMFRKICAAVPVGRRPSHFAAIVTLDVRRAGPKYGGRQEETRAAREAKQWLPLLPHMTGLQEAHFEDLHIKRIASDDVSPPAFEATRIIKRPLRNVIKNPFRLYDIRALGVDIVTNPELKIDLTSGMRHIFGPQSQGQQLLALFTRYLLERKKIFSYSISELSVSVALPLHILQNLYESVQLLDILPPRTLSLSCLPFSHHQLAQFCIAATPRLESVEIGPASSGHSLTLEELIFEFDWSSLGAIKTLAIDVKLASQQQYTYPYLSDTRTCPNTHLRKVVVIVDKSLEYTPWNRPDLKAAEEERYLQRIRDVVTTTAFIQRWGELQASNARMSIKLREHQHWGVSDKDLQDLDIASFQGFDA